MTRNLVARLPEQSVFQPRIASHSLQPSKVKRRIGWGLSWLVGLFLIGASGVPKFMDWPGKAEMLNHMGIAANLLPRIGVLEILVGVLFLIPRTSFLGAILVTGYLGGAVMTHVRIGDPAFNVVFPGIIGLIMWIGLALRQSAIFSLAFGKPTRD
jgi:hypothetical protein